MPTLFTTHEKELKGFFTSLSPEDIQDCCDSKIFYRGEEYYERGLVADAGFNADKTLLTAIVKGSERYTLKISLENGEVSGSCTCPYGGVCKHTVALLLYAFEEGRNIETFEINSNSKDITQYLQTLSKEELIGLVIKYAPEQYFTEIQNRFSGSSEAQNIFRKVEHAIQKIFKDSDLLYNPSDFEEALNEQICLLKGLEQHLKNEIGGLIIYVIREVDDAFDEGYLYTDHYYEEYFEQPEEFASFTENYVRALPYSEKTAFLEKLDSVLGELSYNTFDNLHQLSEKVFNEEDLPALKNMLITGYERISLKLVEKYYDMVRKLMSNTEKEKILSVIKEHNSKWLIELAELYKNENRTSEAIEIIKNWLKEHSNGFGDEIVFILYLDLLKAENYNLTDASKEAISRCPTCTMLQKITTILPNENEPYEMLLEQKSAEQLLNYLEISNRLPEALSLIKRNKGIWDSRVYDFFKKHKKVFPLEAEKYFCEVIDKNLQYTGDSYYYSIADSIQQIKQVNAVYAIDLVRDIRLNYKRRSKLISILSKF